MSESEPSKHDPESMYEAYRQFSAGDLLRALLASRNLTPAELSASAKVGRSTISDLLSGRRRPSRKAAKALGAFFKVDPAAFY